MLACGAFSQFKVADPSLLERNRNGDVDEDCAFAKVRFVTLKSRSGMCERNGKQHKLGIGYRSLICCRANSVAANDGVQLVRSRFRFFYRARPDRNTSAGQRPSECESPSFFSGPADQT